MTYLPAIPPHWEDKREPGRAAYTKNFEGIARDKLMNALHQSLLQVRPSFGAELIRQHSDGESRESFLKTATIQIMSTPEYQMC